MDAVATPKRNRRSFLEILRDLHVKLEQIDMDHAVRRHNLIARIDEMKAKHEELALAVETLDGREPADVLVDLAEQIAELKARKAAVKRLT